MTDENDPNPCITGVCQWGLIDSGEVTCLAGEGDCNDAKLLTTVPSDFHDEALIALTKQINALLEAVPPDPAGRKLSVLHTRMGPLLGWVKHGQEGGLTGAVTAASDNETVIQALGLLL
jgi:hypothetical protein